MYTILVIGEWRVLFLVKCDLYGGPHMTQFVFQFPPGSNIPTEV